MPPARVRTSDEMAFLDDSEWRRPVAILTVGLTAAGIAACGGGGGGAAAPTGPATDAAGVDLRRLTGRVAIDGSSTVEPVSSAVAEDFSRRAPGVEVTVGTSGTGGGFEKFCAGETDLSNASRAIDEEERAACAAAGIDVVELEVAQDATTVVVSPQNDWARCLTVEQLRRMWEPGSDVDDWRQVDPSFPEERLDLYGPGPDSGTFDYFTDVVNGEEGASRDDYTPSEDDNVLVRGVEGDEGGLGYFGYAYYAENRESLRALEVDGGSGCVAPSPETVLDGTYEPLSRPLYVYVSRAALERPEVAAFLRFYLAEAPRIVPEVGYIPLRDYAAEQAKLGGAA